MTETMTPAALQVQSLLFIHMEDRPFAWSGDPGDPSIDWDPGVPKDLHAALEPLTAMDHAQCDACGAPVGCHLIEPDDASPYERWYMATAIIAPSGDDTNVMVVCEECGPAYLYDKVREDQFRIRLKVEHVAYPHEPGMLYDCPACEQQCHCTSEFSECVFEGEHQ